MFTSPSLPDESAAAPTGVVIDVIRATSTICQALASGYERSGARPRSRTRALCGSPDVTLGGERLGVRIEGFDLGNSPREYLSARTPTLAMSTTNGTRAIVTAAERCDRVLIASLLNLDAVVAAAGSTATTSRSSARASRASFALDDSYVAGRIAERLGGDRSDAAEAAVRLAASYATAEEAFRASRSGRNLINHGPELEADIPYCARESMLDVVPRLAGHARRRRRDPRLGRRRRCGSRSSSSRATCASTTTPRSRRRSRAAETVLPLFVLDDGIGGTRYGAAANRRRFCSSLLPISIVAPRARRCARRAAGRRRRRDACVLRGRWERRRSLRAPTSSPYAGARSVARGGARPSPRRCQLRRPAG